MAHSPAQDQPVIQAQPVIEAQPVIQAQPDTTATQSDTATQSQPATIERLERSESRESVYVAPRMGNGAAPAHPREIRDRAFAMYKEGKTYPDIAYELRIPAPTLRAWAKRDSWQERKSIIAKAPGIDAETVARLLTRVEKPAKPATQEDLDLAEAQEKYQTDMRAAALRFSGSVRELDDDELYARANKIKDLDGVARKALKLETEKPSQIIQIGILAQSPVKQGRKSIEQAAPDALTLDV